MILQLAIKYTLLKREKYNHFNKNVIQILLFQSGSLHNKISLFFLSLFIYVEKERLRKRENTKQPLHCQCSAQHGARGKEQWYRDLSRSWTPNQQITKHPYNKISLNNSVLTFIFTPCLKIDPHL